MSSQPASLDRPKRTLRGAVELAMKHLDDLPLHERDAEEERLADALGRASVSNVSSMSGGFRRFSPLPPLRQEAPPLPLELVPEKLRGRVGDSAELMQVPHEMIAIPVLVSASSVIGRKVTIRPKARDTWTVTPNLWGAVVAPPSCMKTPSLALALDPIRQFEDAARLEHEQIERDQAVELIKLQQQEKAIYEQLKQAYKGKAGDITPDGLGESLSSVRERLQKLNEELNPGRYILNDTTVEKAIELFRANPNGLLQERDELTGWLRSLDRDDRKGDREFYLETWAGDRSYTQDRIGRGTVHAPRICLSIIGGMQPGKFAKYVSDAVRGHWRADGLLQRFQLLVWPEHSSEWERVDREPDRQARALAGEVFGYLNGHRLDEEPRHFEVEAQRLFNDWWTELERRLRSPELRASEAFLAHLGKYRSLMPSLALIFHLCSRSAESNVSIAATRLAAAWCEYLEQHARKVYAVELFPGLESAHALAKKIRSNHVEDRTPIRDIYRRQWSRLRDSDQVYEAIVVLEENGWVCTDTAGSGDRPIQVLRINPEVYES